MNRLFQRGIGEEICTLLSLAPSSKLQPPSRILMREIRPGIRLLNAKGKEVMVTNVYFSRENAVMVQISENCHTTITHPLVDVYRPKQRSRYRKNPTMMIAFITFKSSLVP